MTPIKLQIITQAGSSKRGIGLYAKFLIKTLEKDPRVTLVSSNPDLVHYTFFDLFYPTLPLQKKAPTVVTIHDLTPLVLSSLYPKGFRGTLNLLRQRLSLSSVAAICTDSQNSQSDIHRLFHTPIKKITVTPLDVDPSYKKKPSSAFIKKVKAKYNLPQKFVLTVAAGPNPNKNLPRLAAATQKLKLPLVLVGGGLTQALPPSPVHPELKDLVALQQFDHLQFLGFVENSELNALYRLTTVYCQASLYEGFGLPLLEAMNCDCLLASSAVSSLPEIYPKGTITFNPRSTEDISKKIKQAVDLTSSQKAKFLAAGRRKAQQFSWPKTADQTIKVYQQALGVY